MNTALTTLAAISILATEAHGLEFADRIDCTQNRYTYTIAEYVYLEDPSTTMPGFVWYEEDRNGDPDLTEVFTHTPRAGMTCRARYYTDGDNGGGDPGDQDPPEDVDPVDRDDDRGLGLDWLRGGGR